MNNLVKLGLATLIGGLIGVLVFSPVITFVFAYLGGLLLKWIVGSIICDGLNIIFNTNKFTPDLIPVVCATLATIGRYFKSVQTNNNK